MRKKEEKRIWKKVKELRKKRLLPLPNEEDIKKKVKNYIILRLASVYGYSTDSLRISIMYISTNIME